MYRYTPFSDKATWWIWVSKAGIQPTNMGILPATIGEFKEESLDLDGTIWDWSDEQVKMVNVSAKMVTSPRRLSFLPATWGFKQQTLSGWWLTYPFWKIWKSIEKDYPIYYGTIKNVPNHHPVYCLILFFFSNQHFWFNQQSEEHDSIRTRGDFTCCGKWPVEMPMKTARYQLF